MKKHAVGLIVLLTLQYLLGMATIIFVKFPENKEAGQLWGFAWSQLPLAAHIIVGLLLFFGSLALLVKAIKAHNRNWIVSSALGFTFILIAGLAGTTFISSQKDLYSFLMSLAFIASYLSYFWGIYTSKE